MKRDHTIKDLREKLNKLPLSPQEERSNRIGDMSGLISKAKEELEKNRSKSDVKPEFENDLKTQEPKKSEIEMHWEELIKKMDRDLTLCDLDFRDLTEEDDVNILMPRGLIKSSIPPPPPLASPRNGTLPYANNNNGPLGNFPPKANGQDPKESPIKKTKKTVNFLFRLWKINEKISTKFN